MSEVELQCEVPGCEKKVTTAGLCLALEYLKLHYQQVHEEGKEVDIGGNLSEMTGEVIRCEVLGCNFM